jgi:hypothetical protein
MFALNRTGMSAYPFAQRHIRAVLVFFSSLALILLIRWGRRLFPTPAQGTRFSWLLNFVIGLLGFALLVAAAASVLTVIADILKVRENGRSSRN